MAAGVSKEEENPTELKRWILTQSYYYYFTPGTFILQALDIKESYSSLHACYTETYIRLIIQWDKFAFCRSIKI